MTRHPLGGDEVSLATLRLEVVRTGARIRQTPSTKLLELGLLCTLDGGVARREACDHAHHAIQMLNDHSDGFFDELLEGVHSLPKHRAAPSIDERLCQVVSVKLVHLSLLCRGPLCRAPLLFCGLPQATMRGMR